MTVYQQKHMASSWAEIFVSPFGKELVNFLLRLLMLTRHGARFLGPCVGMMEQNTPGSLCQVTKITSPINR